MKKPKKLLLMMQAIFTAIGALTSLIMLQRAIKVNGNVLDIINGIVYVVVYAYAITYAVYNYKNDDKYYNYFIYGYAALLGIEILYSGKMMEGFGLGENTVLLLNTVNLIAFGCVIQFANNLENRKKALTYMGVANGLKFGIELYLIIRLFNYIEPVHMLTALSVPVLGTTLLLAYANRYGED